MDLQQLPFSEESLSGEQRSIQELVERSKSGGRDTMAEKEAKTLRAFHESLRLRTDRCPTRYNPFWEKESPRGSRRPATPSSSSEEKEEERRK